VNKKSVISMTHKKKKTRKEAERERVAVIKGIWLTRAQERLLIHHIKAIRDFGQKTLRQR